MGFLKRLFSKAERELTEGSVVFIGLGNAGKTTILNRLIQGEFMGTTTRTMGLNVDEFAYRKVKFRAFDLGGQDAFHALWGSYVQNAAAVVFVVDASNPMVFPESYDSLKKALKSIPSKCILMILANKSDLDAARTLDEILKTFDLFYLQKQANLKGINIFLVSAKSGDSFYESFDWLVGALTGKQVVLQVIHLHNIWIYESKTGLPLTRANFSSTEDNPELVTPLLSAIDSFASELDSSVAGIGHVVLQGTSGTNIRLVKVVQENLVAILVVDEFDSLKKVTEVGNEILNWVSPRVVRHGDSDIFEEISEEDFLNFIKDSYSEHITKNKK